jgi:hypothetical protein
VEQGTFSHLKDAGGYVQGLDIAGSSRGTSEDSHEEPGDALIKQLTAPADAAADAIAPADAAVWKYYAKSFGWFKITMFVVFLVISGVAGSFRCTNTLSSSRISM